MGKDHYSPGVRLRKVINNAIYKTTLSSIEKERYFVINRNTDPKVAAPEILKALKLHISSESRGEIFSALQNLKSEETQKKTASEVELKSQLLVVDKTFQ
jgi:ADP-dependent phosphofructokinase/glucokinase